MLFLYGDDRLHFKYNKHLYPNYKMVHGLVSLQGWLLKAGKDNKERQTGMLHGGHGRLIEVAA